MEFRESELPGCLEVIPRVAEDDRGRFAKVFHAVTFAERGLVTSYAEQYHTHSVAGVLRGLHFQTPPAEHAKLVCCVAGSAWDVALDLRAGSPTFGRHASFELRADRGNAVYLPAGIAHGFCTPAEPATLVYAVQTVHSAAHDDGVRWDSAGIDWPLSKPVLSPRDRGFAALQDFETPFRFAGR